MRRSLKGALIVLVLGLMELLLWQLQFDFRQLKDNQRALNLAVSEQMAKQLSLSMASMASAGCAVLYATEESPGGAQHERYLDNLRAVFPSLQRLTRLDASGQPLPGSTLSQAERQVLAELVAQGGGRHYHYAFDPRDGGGVYLLLHTEQGNWALQLRADSLNNWLLKAPQQEVSWLLEDTTRQRVIADSRGFIAREDSYPAVTAENQAQTILLQDLPGSAW